MSCLSFVRSPRSRRMSRRSCRRSRRSALTSLWLVDGVVAVALDWARAAPLNTSKLANKPLAAASNLNLRMSLLEQAQRQLNSTLTKRGAWVKVSESLLECSWPQETHINWSAFLVTRPSRRSAVFSCSATTARHPEARFSRTTLRLGLLELLWDRAT